MVPSGNVRGFPSERLHAQPNASRGGYDLGAQTACSTCCIMLTVDTAKYWCHSSSPTHRQAPMLDDLPMCTQVLNEHLASMGVLKQRHCMVPKPLLAQSSTKTPPTRLPHGVQGMARTT